VHQTGYPLQTRACFLLPDRLSRGLALAEFLDGLVQSGYNTVVFPALYDGEAVFDVRSRGNLRQKACAAQEAMTILQDFPLTVWLGVDLISAGTPGSGRLGALARRNRSWLMKNVNGSYEAPPDGQLPGMFCWTTLDYRRFVANLVVDIVEAFALDGLLLDLSNLPRTTEDPSTWMNLGYSSLQRMQKELGIDGEAFLANPTIEKFHEIEDWRLGELRQFIAGLKARVCKARQGLPVALMANIIEARDPYIPWLGAFEEGVVEEVVLRGVPALLPGELEALDEKTGQPRAVLAAVESEKDLGPLAQVSDRLSTTGVCLTHPEYTAEVDFPPVAVRWSLPGAIERHPITAGAAALIHLARSADSASPFGIYVGRLRDYLEYCGDKVKYEDVLVVRGDLLFLRQKIEAKEIQLGADQRPLLSLLDLSIRLFSLIPAPAVMC
jgi:hypothetical protein